MIKTRALQYAYHPHQTLSFPDITLGERQDLLILGESGIGKTTLLHLLAGLLPARAGSILVNDTEITQLSAGLMDRFRGQHIGIVFQRPYFVQALTVDENLRLVQHVARRPVQRERIARVLDALGLATQAKRRTQQLSQGEQQRAAIALAVINRPTLLLADEPTASLDDKNCQRVITLLREQAAETGAHLLVITHDQRLKSKFSRTLTL